MNIQSDARFLCTIGIVVYDFAESLNSSKKYITKLSSIDKRKFITDYTIYNNIKLK